MIGRADSLQNAPREPWRFLPALARAGLAGSLLIATLAARAHEYPSSATAGWRVAPWVVPLLATAALLYIRGLVALWRHAGAGRGIERRQTASFAAGWAVLALALAPPIDPLGAQLFSMHMIQHELLMVVAAPLLVLGRPFAAWSWAWPAAARRVHRAFAAPALGIAWHHVTSPLGAWLLHTIALWTWHVPLLFDAALARSGVHEWQHVSFLLLALLFWWSILGRRAAARAHAAALLSLFTTMLHTGLLGALLTLSPHVWYAAYETSAPALGFDPLHDQQLGGLLMWVPAGAAYVVAALAAASRLLGSAPAGAARQ